MKKNTGKINTRFLVELAVLIAIELLLEVTGLGYLKTGPLEFTLMLVPVIVGAIVLGPLAGAILGGVFGPFSTLSFQWPGLAYCLHAG